jgi:diguanylate cyclase (GGDEF)-like protein
MENHQQPLSAKLLQEMQALEGRDLHLWSVGVMVLLVVAAGFAALIIPNLVWGAQNLRVDSRYFPQVFYGFVTLILLFNLYAFGKKRELNQARAQFVRELIGREVAEMAALKDPLTDTFNRRYFDQIIQGEVNRANRRSTELAVIMIDVDDFKSVNTDFGHLVGDRVLVELAQLLKSTFRSCDIVVRYGGDEFLVLVTDSDEGGAKIALERLQQGVEAWNRANLITGYRMELSCGVAGYAKGARIQDVVEAADARMFVAKRSKHAPSRDLSSLAVTGVPAA